MTNHLDAPLTNPEPLPATEPLPIISERRRARAVRACARESGLDLIPRMRPVGMGGVADMMAVHRHNRRIRARGLRAA